MKYGTIICFLLLATTTQAQKSRIDSLHSALKKEKIDSNRVAILWRLSNMYTGYRPDSTLYLSQEALLLTRRIKYERGEANALKQMAEAYQNLGNYPESLKYYLKRLKLDEKSKDADRQVVTLLSIANLYQLQADYRHALEYAHRGNALIEANKLSNYKWYAAMVFGEMYEKLNDIPNAIKYNNLSYQIALAKKDSAWIGMCLNNTGNTLARAKKTDEALSYYNTAIPYLIHTHNLSFLCETYQGIGRIKVLRGELDSASHYAQQSLQLADEAKLIKKYMLACELITDIFKARNMSDSALAYQTKLLLIKDSVNSQDKIRQVESMTIAEELRQKEIEEARLLEEKELKHKLNLLLVGLLIPIFFFLCIFLSKRKISSRIVEFLGIISLLILFEYLTLWFHPFVARITNHTPLFEIIILVALAAFLTPAHHRLEHWLLHRLTTHKQKLAEVPIIKPVQDEELLKQYPEVSKAESEGQQNIVTRENLIGNDSEKPN